MRSTVFLATLIASASIPFAVAASDKSLWTLETSIAARSIVAESGTEQQALPGGNNVVVASPNGKYFFVVTETADLECDCRIDELLVFLSADALKAVKTGNAPAPLNRLKVESTYGGNGDWMKAIHAPRWDENDSILFFSAKSATDRGIYRFFPANGSVERLTDKRYVPVWVFSTGANKVGHTAGVFLAVDMQAPTTQRAEAFDYPFSAIDAQRMSDMNYPLTSSETRSIVDRSPPGLYAFVKGHPTRLIARTEPGVGPPVISTWLSPDETKAIVAWGITDVEKRARWSDYDRPAPPRVYQFMHVDLKTGDRKPLLDAPVGFSATRIAYDSIYKGRGGSVDLFWSDDGRHAMLVNTALPVAAGHPEYRSMSYIVDYDLRTDTWKILEPFEQSGRYFKSAEWLERGKKLSVTYADRDGRRVGAAAYTATAAGWKRADLRKLPPVDSSRTVALPDGLKVELREDPNTPQRLFISANGREVDLLGADPALVDKWIAPVEIVRWQGSDGKEIEGGMLLPRDRTAGKALPLVIQAYHFNRDKFEPDGNVQDSWAAQTLAAQGFAVLFMDIPLSDNEQGKTRNNIEQRRYFRDSVDAAVESLARKGIVDPSKVGVIGYSRSGYYVHHLVTHPGRTRIGAARVSDSFTGGYGEYTADAAEFDTADQALAMSSLGFNFEYGGQDQNFWQNKAIWLEEAPGFNVEKSQTPTMFSLNGTRQILASASETLAAWKLNRRPIEYLVFPNATHGGLPRPRQWYESMKASVEWMAFWLQGKTPLDPERAERWGRIKSDWETQHAWEAAGHPPGSKPASAVAP